MTSKSGDGEADGCHETVHGKAGDKDKRGCKIREEKGRTGEVSSLDKMPEIAYFFCSERTGETCEAFSPEGS